MWGQGLGAVKVTDEMVEVTVEVVTASLKVGKVDEVEVEVEDDRVEDETFVMSIFLEIAKRKETRD